ncbi:MAG: recombinase family protein [Sphingomonadales bacterium]|nr:recombinase family protein [Sphingomonadales bacterium]
MTLRCAIYTRKSTEEGLEQDFNSLHAQREACEAYIKSQSSEGWKCLPNTYDDGGYSGGSMERPGLKQLLADIDLGKVDVVVVYKVDRLTRSLMDFAQIVQKLEAKGVSFVSVTQSFNTTSSMGRLTLNVLLSFAQFEREVTAERIRDKIAASKQKGMWMGGPVPLGYDLEHRQLLVNEAEAITVRWLYDTYLEVRCVRELKIKADQLGLSSKHYTQQSGKVVGGHTFARGQLYHILNNPLYLGKIRHKDKLHDGQHEAILSQDTWDKVQALLTENWGKRRQIRNTPSHGWVARILIDSLGDPMVASHSRKQGRIYRYYISSSLTHKKSDPAHGWRLPAKEIEGIVLKAVQSFLNDPVKVLNAVGVAKITAALMAQTQQAAMRLIQAISSASLANLATLLRPLIHQVQVNLYEVVIKIDTRQLCDILGIHADPEAASINHTITLPVQLKRRGAEMRIVIPGQEQHTTKRDEKLVTLIAQSHHWFEQIKARISIKEIAEANNIHVADISRVMPLAFLAPEIATAILNGNHPVDLTAEKLKRLRPLPHLWSEQKHALGFE